MIDEVLDYIIIGVIREAVLHVWAWEWQLSLLQKVRQLKSENKFIFLNHDSEQIKNSWCYICISIRYMYIKGSLM